MDLRLEDAYLSALISLPAGPGNAARDMMEATHQVPFHERDRTAMPYEGFDQIYLPGRMEEDSREKWRMLEHSVIPEIQTYRWAARRGGYRMWGEIVPLDPELHWFEYPIPYYTDFNHMNILCLVRAREAVLDGKDEEALAWYRDAIIIGNHLEKDGLVSQLIGTKVKYRAANDLLNYYFLRDEISRAASWGDMFYRETDRYQLIHSTILAMHQYYFSDSDMTFIIENPSFSPVFRMRAYELLSLRWECGGIWRLLFGPSRQEKQYLLDTDFDCPKLTVVQQMSAVHLTHGFLHRCRTLIDYYDECY